MPKATKKAVTKKVVKKPVTKKPVTKKPITKKAVVKKQAPAKVAKPKAKKVAPKAAPKPVSVQGLPAIQKKISEIQASITSQRTNILGKKAAYDGAMLDRASAALNQAYQYINKIR